MNANADVNVSEQALKNIHWDRLEEYLRKELSMPSEEMKVKQFTAGYSNLTFLIQCGQRGMVLRRPPFGYVPPKAHDMEREFKILSKLHPVFSRAPKPYLFEFDTNIMEKHFYVMERKEGVVIDERIPDNYLETEGDREKISCAVIDTLVDLHSVDYKKAGLGDLGRPEGFLKRQVESWIKRYEKSKVKDFTIVNELVPWLLNHIPSSPHPSIIHNDYKMNNMMFSSADPSEIVGIFDWELCTVGDPLIDLGSTIVYWKEKGDPDIRLTAVTDQKGFLSRREMIERYARKSGIDTTNIQYYLVLAFFRLAVILQQLYYRWDIGELKDNRVKDLYVGIVNLLELAKSTKDNKLI
ncbi:phosphotransferase family protein [Alteribacillus persepolensis]|uniref:phosphotransferase family protein n=1 Tax=Alteribacillus persepolensis TaxID=568899 RepID=UPI001FE1CF28|nr:phosphotransferase family protein [Alteribacillus persepolensis]